MRPIVFGAVLAFTTAAHAGGGIKGSVVFDGEPPAPKKITPTTDTAICGQQNLVDESLIVDPKTKGVRSVAIWIKGSKRSKKDEAPIIDNRRCRYEPHLVIARAGEPLTIRNRDPFLHTTKAQTDKGKVLFNVALPVRDQTVERKLAKPGAYELVCDVHTWMKGWALVLEDEIATVTADDGTFALTDLPAGMHTLELWHETLGSKTVTVEAKDGLTAETTIRWKR